MCVYRSLNNIYVQVIDDVAGNTLVAASTLDKDLAGVIADKTKKEASRSWAKPRRRRLWKRNQGSGL